MFAGFGQVLGIDGLDHDVIYDRVIIIVREFRNTRFGRIMVRQQPFKSGSVHQFNIERQSQMAADRQERRRIGMLVQRNNQPFAKHFLQQDSPAAGKVI